MKWTIINSEIGTILITEDKRQVPIPMLKTADIVLIKIGNQLMIDKDDSGLLNI